MESRALGQARWLAETVSPSSVSSPGRTPFKVVSFLHNLDKTWLWSVLGAHFSLREQPRSSVLLTQSTDERVTLVPEPHTFPSLTLCGGRLRRVPKALLKGRGPGVLGCGEAGER